MFLYRLWLKFIRFWRRIMWLRKIYRIIPFGEYCLPRVITTLNGFKPSKKEGEKSFPFDLCFSNFESNLKLLSENFKNFYTDLEYNSHHSFKNCWVNKKFNLVFNHDHMPSLQEFVERYNRRIKNLYEVLEEQDKHLYFIVATFESINNKQMDLFIKEIKKYRDDKTFSVIVINQSDEKTIYKHPNVYCIDLLNDVHFKKINNNGNWAVYLKKIKNYDAMCFNYNVSRQISRIIKKSI